jgi:uroporphyrinogen-III synthase
MTNRRKPVSAPEAASGCDLNGLGVLVTRAAHQAGPLCRLIAAHGGRPWRFPALEIVPAQDPGPARALLRRLDQFDLAIFVSPNAVAWALAVDGAAHALANAQRVAAVGESTAKALAQAGVGVDLVPESGRHDSEGLLASRALEHVSGWRALIVRGEGGRELLAAELRRRGAEVDYAEVYRRAVPETDPAPLLERWDADVQAVVATSADVLANLALLLGEAGLQRLRRTPLVVVSERMAEQARTLGCTEVIQAGGAHDHQVLEALCRRASAT